MPRAIVTGNGNLMIGINYKNMIEDLYFPYVGMENHIGFQHYHRVGVFENNSMSWLFDDSWEHSIKYMQDTLVTDSVSKNKDRHLTLHFNDFVYPTENAFIRKITVINDDSNDRYLKLFFGQDIHLYGDKQQDTAFYEPEEKALVHYRKQRYFWVSGFKDGKEGIDSYTTGKSEYQGMVGTWKDAEDGHLEEHAIEQGSVDSTVEFDLKVKGHGSAVLYFWICAGEKINEVKSIHNFIMDQSPEKLLKNTINYWTSWVNKEPDKLSDIPVELQNIYKQVLLIMRTQIDNRGAIIASTDLDIMKFNKDTYTYMWPRDGAWVALALDRAGYGEISAEFFEFCAKIVTKEGYLLPKYLPDYSVGSSWHPSMMNGETQLPIQEDETGILLFALFKHYQNFGDIEFMQKMYIPLVHSMGNFLVEFRDKITNLPNPSYDLWERERGISAYTCSAVYAGLMGAAYLSETLGHFNHHKKFEKAALEVRDAILKYFYDNDKSRFLKRIEINEKTGEIKKDYIIDASMHALWMFGVLPPEDDRIFDTNEAIFRALEVPTEIGGLTRYEYDDYQRVDGDYSKIPGNPWIITTLWHAQWLMSIAKNLDGLKPVEKYINWAIRHMNEAKILPEQLNPFTGMHISVSPLTWSHAVFVDTVLQYNERLKELS